MSRPWFSFKGFTPREPRESRRRWHGRMQVSDLGWMVGAARHQDRVRRLGRNRAGKGIVGYR